MRIGGLQRLTLIDYPDKLACTVFTLGCNFRCPWCYSPHLVIEDKIKESPSMTEEDFFDFLDKRKDKLEGVVICGGEPTIYSDIIDFIRKIKEKGFLVKLDTNGSFPDILKKLIDERLVDYIAMDIKGSFLQVDNASNYNKSTGVNIDIDIIRKSIEIIVNGGVDYEFRTTTVSGIHTKEDISEMAKMIKGAKRYFLQNFYNQSEIISKKHNFSSFSKEEMEDFRKTAEKFVEVCELR